MSLLLTFQRRLLTTDIFVILILLVCFLVLLLGINHPKIQTWDELTNIEVVVESPGLNLMFGGSPFFEKPPLWYWLTGLLTSIFGNHTWVYRLPSVLSAIGIILTMYLFLKRKGSRTLAFAIAISFLLIPQNLITNHGGYFSSHTFKSADLDPLQIFLIFLSSILLLSNRKYWILSCALLGLAFLVKGPLTIMFLCLNSFVYFKTSNDFNLKILFKGIMLFLLIILPWHLYMISTFGSEFLNTYFGYHVVSRSTNQLEGHAQPVLFYLKIFFDFDMNPFWLLFLLAVVFGSFRKLYLKYSFVVVVALVLLLSLVETKLAWYLLPVYPFMLVFIHGLFSKLKPSVIITKSRR